MLPVDQVLERLLVTLANRRDEYLVRSGSRHNLLAQSTVPPFLL